MIEEKDIKNLIKEIKQKRLKQIDVVDYLVKKLAEEVDKSILESILKSSE